MSTQATVSPLHRRRQSLRPPKWPLRLGRLLRDAVQDYADSVCVAYTMTLGLDRKQEPTARDRDY
jgi:hypothetical protein